MTGNSLAISGLTVRYRNGVYALRDVSLDVRAGEFLCILGPSGCGKSTLLKSISGIVKPISGSIAVGGATVDRLPMERRNVGFVFQNYALFPHMTVYGNIAYGLRIKGVGKDEIRRRCDGMLRLTGLSDLADRYPQQLSGGQQQRVALARAIAPNPSVLLLDEPLSALDKAIRQRLRNDLRHIQKDLGLTALFVTHDQEEAFELADRVAVMNEGVVEQVGTPEEVYDSPKTEFAASFVGLTNVLGGTVRDGKVHVGLTGLFADVTAVNREGSFVREAAATVYVRPEDVILQTCDEAQLDAGGDIAVISDARYLGPVISLNLRLDDGTSLTATVPKERAKRKGFRTGEKVAVWIRPNRVVLKTSHEDVKVQLSCEFDI